MAPKGLHAATKKLLTSQRSPEPRAPSPEPRAPSPEPRKCKHRQGEERKGKNVRSFAVERYGVDASGIKHRTEVGANLRKVGGARRDEDVECGANGAGGRGLCQTAGEEKDEQRRGGKGETEEEVIGVDEVHAGGAVDERDEPRDQREVRVFQRHSGVPNIEPIGGRAPFPPEFGDGGEGEFVGLEVVRHPEVEQGEAYGAVDGYDERQEQEGR